MIHRSRISAFALLVLPPLLWSTMIVVGRAVIGEVPPAALTFWTWLIAALSLMPFSGRELRAGAAVIRSEFPSLCLCALLGVAAFQGLFYAGLERTSAINASLLSPTLPLMVAALGWRMLGERLGAVQILGLAFAMGGAAWISVAGDWQNLVALRLGAGEILILSANLCMAGYTVMLRRRPSRLAPLPFMTVIAFIGSAMLLPVYLMEHAWVGDASAPARHWAALFYIGIVTYSLAYVLWNVSVKRHGATVTALYLYLIPVFGTVLAAYFLREGLFLYHGVGVVLIFVGIYLSLHVN